MKYDLVVIGGGPGGYTGAIRAAKHGMKVALIEERDLGGTCLNRGCIPTKALLHTGEIFSGRSEWEGIGIIAGDVSIDQERLYAHKDTVVKNLRDGVENLIKANKIDLYKAKGVITGAHTVNAGEETLETDFILIATGSRPAGFDPKRPINGIENALDSDAVLSAPVSGGSVIIIGAGVIGVEFASYFNYIGKTVTLLATGERIIKMMSKEMSVQLSSVLKKSGINIIANAKVQEISKNREVTFDAGKGEEKISADAVVCAVGRNANVSGIGLEAAGVEYDRYIKVDERFYTGRAGIYACGDCTGGIQLAHYAAASAITAVENMLKKENSIDLSVVPSCIYTRPEIVSVGKSEAEVPNAKSGKFLMSANGKSMIEGINRGFIKVISDENDVIVGAELFSARATDLAGELALAISRKLKREDVSGVIHPHPTVMEAVAEAVEDTDGFATHMLPKRK